MKELSTNTLGYRAGIAIPVPVKNDPQDLAARKHLDIQQVTIPL